MTISRRLIISFALSLAALSASQNVLAQAINFKNPPIATKVMPRETLFDIAERTKSPLIGLIKLNNLRAPSELNEGQTIKIPPLKVHIVKTGEKLDDIAKRYSIDKRSLAVFNELKKPYNVKVGQKIIMPALVRDKYTGLEPQDLVDLLSIEIGRGNKTSGQNNQITITKPTNTIETPKIDIAPNTAMAGFFNWPLNGKIIDTFGEKANSKKNDGIDIEAQENMPFRAAADGRVVYAGNQLAGYGWLILIQHNNGYTTAYAYGSEILVSEDEIVKKGQIIGRVGLTGRAPTPRLQFQIRKGIMAVNPISFLPK